MRVCAWDAFSVDRLTDVTTGVVLGSLDGVRISQDATMGNVGGLLVLTQRHVMAVANASQGHQSTGTGTAGTLIAAAAAQMVCEADDAGFIALSYDIGLPDPDPDLVGEFICIPPTMNPTPSITPVAAETGYQSVQPTDLTNAAVRIGQSPQMGIIAKESGLAKKNQGVANASNVMSASTARLSKNIAAIATSLEHINNSILSIQELYRLDVASALNGVTSSDAGLAGANLKVVSATQGETALPGPVTQAYSLIVAIAA